MIKIGKAKCIYKNHVVDLYKDREFYFHYDPMRKDKIQVTNFSDMLKENKDGYIFIFNLSNLWKVYDKRRV